MIDVKFAPKLTEQRWLLPDIYRAHAQCETVLGAFFTAIPGDGETLREKGLCPKWHS